ncbi:radical SAM family heme chaperone HemW [Lacinutrix sp. C3R15]|uniref:radical SAM family heme chaperone HemW n=1 Tax=Flavobacteriaceae TaxID=49546 RepID=UPI001C0A2009|nr:radical SAM family heme chaperone HemW [Oceanihabitans sp. 1_MG-2023]MBU2939089.1 radical SAM family heme chaperone HemW [Lacinutrix sp. C3R15]MDO6622404.1 radical SAM family heme chaperone HemW [Oceanihabitans sp. 1_MG-2023]
MSGIYIHIPFCKQACHYCDFHFSTSMKKKDELVHALITELALRKNELKNQVVETIYFGGGTPSLLTNNELLLLINTVHQNYNVSKNTEITLEANPDDLTKDRIVQLSKTPINRLSIGVQSFFEDDLQSMNRAHHAEEAEKCLEYASQYYNNITIDLIYGIPNMSLKKWQANLEKAFSFGVNHISSYALTVEPKTALATFIAKGNYPPIDEDLALQHFNHLVAETQKQGFVHYEISNFGKPNFFSKHNTSYWQGKSYIGIGPSAHSFSKTQRSWNVANNTKYIQSIQNKLLPNTIETLSPQDQYNEYVMTGLRTIWGVSLQKIETNFGIDYKSHILKVSQKYIESGLLKTTSCTSGLIEETFIIATQKGKFLVDGIASEMFIV